MSSHGGVHGQGEATQLNSVESLASASMGSMGAMSASPNRSAGHRTGLRSPGPLNAMDYSRQRQHILFGLPRMQVRSSGSDSQGDGEPHSEFAASAAGPKTTAGAGVGPDIEDNSEEGRFRAVLAGLQQQLLALVLEPLSVESADLIQSEAAFILILGVELFYPSQTHQADLLAELLTSPGPPGSPAHPDRHGSSNGEGMQGLDGKLGSSPGPSVVVPARAGNAAARYFLLNPLLQRLADDTLASKLIPSPLQPAPTLSPSPALPFLGPNQASAGVLSTLLRLLVKRLVVESSNMNYCGSPLDEPSMPPGLQGMNGMTGRPVSNQNRDKPVVGGDQTYHLLTDFLLTLQKHLMSWAANQSDSALGWDLVTSCLGDNRPLDDDDDGSLHDGLHDHHTTPHGAHGPHSHGAHGAQAHVAMGPHSHVVAETEHAQHSSVLGGAAPGNASNAAGGAAVFEASVSTLGLLASSVPSGWSCLLEYAQMLLLHSIELLTKIVGASASGPSHSASSAFGHAHRNGSSGNSQFDLLAMQRSLVGLILPSLITGLLPFAYQPVFAKRLMKLITRFAQLLDALCFNTPELRTVDSNYIKHRLGEAGFIEL